MAVLGQVVPGDIHARQVTLTQPVKMAAFEARWDTGGNAPLNLIAIPDTDQEKNLLEIGIPGALNWLIHGDTNAKIQGLKDFAPEDRPPLQATYWSYRIMMLSTVWLLLVVWGLILLIRGQIFTHRRWLSLTFYSMLLPVLISELGWMATEFGRQPWIVYGLLRTQEAASPLPAHQILLTIIVITVMYSFLLSTLIYLLKREVQKALDEEMSVAVTQNVQVSM